MTLSTVEYFGLATVVTRQTLFILLEIEDFIDVRPPEKEVIQRKE